MRRFSSLVAALVALPAVTAGPVQASGPAPGFRMEVLVDGRPVPQYPARGTVYIEALKGREYAIRLHNPLDIRVAVALSVDGLNSIDARHTSATDARKWVLDPHETITISGWQTDMNNARKFYFTSEQDSYAQWLGKTANMGVITAVFFRERGVRIDPIVTAPIERSDRNEAAAGSAGAAGRPGAAAEGQASGAAKDQARREAAVPPAAAQGLGMPVRGDEYAATGIGDSTSHPVHRIHMDLEDAPAATLNMRYEFRAQLVRLGVLPPVPARPDPLARREGARGFDQDFCPVPPIRRK